VTLLRVLPLVYVSFYSKTFSCIMARRYVTNKVQNMIVGMRLAGLLLSEIEIIVDRLKLPISRIIKGYHEHGSIELPKRSRRPRKLEDGHKRILRKELLKNRCAPLAELACIFPTPVCIKTLKKEVHEFDMKNWIAVKKLFLNDKHKANRLAFAKEHLYWTVEDWSRVIWIDEASFEIGKLLCQIWVWQRAYKRYQWDYIAPVFKIGRSSIMV
jgi:transposase